MSQAAQTAQATTAQTTSAVHGTHGASVVEKTVFTTLHTSIVAGVTYWLFHEKVIDFSSPTALVSTLLGTDCLRETLVSGAALVYLLRAVYMTHHLQHRVMKWAEVITVSTFLVFVHGAMGYATRRSGPMDGLPLVAALLYVTGSFLNTWSERSRMVWKQDPANKGKLYTQGLWRYSMHINYFGDCALFSGYALMTGQWWAQIVPLVMFGGFVSHHIPDLDAYLAQRYPEEFKRYAAHTAKLVPFIY